jgi:hypothetical protein
MRFLAAIVIAISLLCCAMARADGCYLCHSGSACDQCRYGSTDTQEARKACEARGCRVQGTTTCSGAANIKYCSVQPASPPVLACYQQR